MPSLQVGLQQTIGVTFGTWEFTIGAILITIMAVVRRKCPDVLAFLSSLITGLGIDMWLFVVKQVWIPNQWLDKILFLCFGLIFIGSRSFILFISKIFACTAERNDPSS